MNYKAMFLVVMVLFVLPFIITALVMEQTKRSIAVFACLLLGIVALWAFGQTSQGAPLWAWLHTLNHVLLIVAVCWFMAMLAALAALLRRRQRLRRLEWTSQPSQQQFSRSCLAYLRRAGWIPRGRLSRMFIDIERMDRGSRKATFLFSAHPFPLEAVRRLMSQTVWRPHGQIVVVTWHEQVTGMRTMIDNMGWRSVSVDRLRAEEAEEKGRE